MPDAFELDESTSAALASLNEALATASLHLARLLRQEKKGGKPHHRSFKKGELTYWRHCDTYTYTHPQGEADICVTLVVLAVSAGTKVSVKGPDGTELGPLGGGAQTKCIKISAGQTITVHAQGTDKSDGATGHVIECTCPDKD